METTESYDDCILLVVGVKRIGRQKTIIYKVRNHVSTLCFDVIINAALHFIEFALLYCLIN